MDQMAAIRQTFFQECEEQLIELENGLLAIQGGDTDKETINAVFRAVHSIKGGAGAFNLTDIVHFAHVFENTLDLVRTDRLAPHPALLAIMLRATDLLADLVIAGREGRESDPSRAAELAAALGSQSGEPEPAAAEPAEEFVFEPIAVSFDDFDDFAAPEPAGPKGFLVRFTPKPELYARGNETAILFRELEKLGRLTIECDDSNLPMLDALDPEGAYLSWIVHLEGECDEAAIAEIFDFVEWDSDLWIGKNPHRTPSPL